MKFDIKTLTALLAGFALYIAIGPSFDRNRDFVDCLVLAELLSRVVKVRQT
jgi:hypothetical protein